MFEALEIGTDGVVLRTDDPEEPRRLAAYLRDRPDAGGLLRTSTRPSLNLDLLLSASV
jgi:3-dehydroquinate synthase class II